MCERRRVQPGEPLTLPLLGSPQHLELQRHLPTTNYPSADVHFIAAAFHTHRTALHRDPALLLILAAVKIPDLAREPRRDNVIRAEERVDKRRLAVVDVREDGNVLQGGARAASAGFNEENGRRTDKR